MSIEKASAIFRAMMGDSEVYEQVTLEDVDGIIPAITFSTFLDRNKIKTYEGVKHEPRKVICN